MNSVYSSYQSPTTHLPPAFKRHRWISLVFPNNMFCFIIESNCYAYNVLFTVIFSAIIPPCPSKVRASVAQGSCGFFSVSIHRYLLLIEEYMFSMDVLLVVFIFLCTPFVLMRLGPDACYYYRALISDFIL